jgi:hypothetical protein
MLLLLGFVTLVQRLSPTSLTEDFSVSVSNPSQCEESRGHAFKDGKNSRDMSRLQIGPLASARPRPIIPA